MTIFDYVVIAIVGLSILLGVMRGAVKEVFALAGWIVAFLAAKSASVPLAAMLEPTISNPSMRLVAAFIAVFVVALIVMGLLSLVVAAAVKKIGLGPIDRVLGLGIGAARGLVIMLVLVILGGMTALPKQPDWRNALTSKWFETLALGVKPWLPEGLAKHIQFGSNKNLEEKIGG
jgi:membrane protein required for colicin V production